jgi:hypothetical protein
MRKTLFTTFLIVMFFTTMPSAGLIDDILKAVNSSSKKGPDNTTVISGLKEALSIGTEKAVKNVSQIDVYFANEMIKILIPEKIQAETLPQQNISKQKHMIKSMARSSLSSHRA